MSDLVALLEVLQSHGVRVYKHDGLEIAIDHRPVIVQTPELDKPRTSEEQDRDLRSLRGGADLRHIRGARQKRG